MSSHFPPLFPLLPLLSSSPPLFLLFLPNTFLGLAARHRFPSLARPVGLFDQRTKEVEEGEKRAMRVVCPGAGVGKEWTREQREGATAWCGPPPPLPPPLQDTPPAAREGWWGVGAVAPLDACEG